MVNLNRNISDQDELISLIMEMLHLERQPSRFKANLDVLAQSLKDLIGKGNFSIGTKVLSSLKELEESSQLPEENKNYIQKFIYDSSNKHSLALIKKVFYEKEKINFDDFFEYLRLLGPETIPLVAQLYRSTEDNTSHKKALSFLKETGKQNISALMNTVQNHTPLLTKEVISILSTVRDKKALHYLAQFTNYQDESIKEKTIQALGKFENKTANKILTAFLEEKEENLRIQAVQNLNILEDQNTFHKVLKIVKDKTFRKRSFKEKQAFLHYLAKTQRPQALSILKSILKKPGLLSNPKNTETGFAVLSVLKELGTPEAIRMIEEGTRIGSKKIKKACYSLLQEVTGDDKEK